MREIVLDTETTGLDPFRGDRLVEVGCIELLNRIPSGQTFHRYINPQRDVPEEAYKVHGLSTQFLADKPLFADVCDELLAFIGDAPLVIHNASFDIAFLNAELDRCGKVALARERLVDTLMLARRKFVGVRNSLDDLCGRFGIDNSKRTKHGALLDAELLAEVYLELIEARQAQLGLTAAAAGPMVAVGAAAVARVRVVPLLARVTEAERAAHRAFIATLGDKAIWRDYLSTGAGAAA
ncbi:MAG TPA: DNA polymerase III subunit epsilon [Xanthobacteraceae bacterium]|nr:DNA polymerase III subunit epsilon [Xanthobacteraceae bacterium]